MTPRQIERIKKKIADIRRTLAAEKRKFGWNDDTRGLRYMPPGLFIQLGDYAGGLTYLRWFGRNFPDDAGFPQFLFEWTIILAKTGKLTDASAKAFQTFCSNPYLFDKFFGRPIQRLDMWHSSNFEEPESVDALSYSSQQVDLQDFAEWLGGIITEDQFIRRADRYVEIQKLLGNEREPAMRRKLVDEAYLLKMGGSRRDEQK